MKKYAITEGTAKVLSPEAQQKAQETLHKQGKTSARDLTDSQREEFDSELRDTEQ